MHLCLLASASPAGDTIDGTVAQLEDYIIASAQAHGCALVGFARLRRLEERAGFLHVWLAEGRAGGMDWLARNPETRLDPRLRDPRLQSVICLAFRYAAPQPPRIDDWRASLRGRIAAYGLGPDYHRTVLAKARLIAAELIRCSPGAVTRIYVDTGPVLEREWAANAGLGWFGRNTNLINRYHGSYFFLAEIFTSLELEAATEPYREHCGTCRRCLDLCPTGALANGLLLEPRLCISYLTIEHRGPIPRELRPKLGNWIFGCDVCQQVCPWNDDAARSAAVNDDLMPSLPDLIRLDEAEFRRRFGRTAISRTKRRGLLRNTAIALGNSENPEAIPILADVLGGEPEALVRLHAAWALGRLGPSARSALEKARLRELDPEVCAEIDHALEGALDGASA